MLSRRAFSCGLGTLLAGACTAERALAAAVDGVPERRAGRDRLWLTRSDGSEIVSRFRDASGGYERDQVMLLSWFLRDRADSDQAVWMEPRLLDLLAAVQSSMSEVHGSALALNVTSGYRTTAHNAGLENAARNSMHLYGYAADVQIRGYTPRAVALAASFFSNGGIGLYSAFTHLDVWRERTWMQSRAGAAPPTR